MINEQVVDDMDNLVITDVLVIGGGASGLTAAIEAKPCGGAAASSIA